MGDSGSGGAKPYGWANRALQAVKCHASAPDTSPWAERTLRTFISMGDPGKEKPEGAAGVQAHISMGTAEAGMNRAARTVGGDAVKAHASIGNPMGLEKDLKAFGSLAGMSGPQSALLPHDPQEEAGLASFETQGYPHVLISFVYDRKGDFFTRRLGYAPVTWMGDSGAFTVWTKGETVNLDEYIAWCRNYLAINPDFTVVSLDVRPGSPGQPPTRKENDRSMKQSLENGDALRDAGLHIVEVYHLHEPLSFFAKLLERRRPGDKVGLGGGATAPFCDVAFGHLRDNYGWDNLPPVHGFGVSPTAKLGGRYPWYSCDSSSWMASARFGQAIGRGGKKGESDSRSTNILYLQRVLERWNRTELELTRLWDARGIRFAP